MSAVMHQLDERSFDADKLGFYTARCTCKRFKFGPIPGLVEVIDVLMSHAQRMGAEEAWALASKKAQRACKALEDLTQEHAQ